jgi:hypothetical protein
MHAESLRYPIGINGDDDEAVITLHFFNQYYGNPSSLSTHGSAFLASTIARPPDAGIEIIRFSSKASSRINTISSNSKLSMVIA